MSQGGGYGGYRPPPEGPRRPSRRPPPRAQMLPLPGSGLDSGDYYGDQAPTDDHRARRATPGGPHRTTVAPGHAPPPSRGEPPYGHPPERPPTGARPRRRRRRVGRILLALLLAFVLFIAGIWIYLEFSIKRVDALHDYTGRPAAAAGTNWLIVGSDSRAGLSEAEAQRLATGDVNDAGGQRTDTIMIAHIPDGDTKPTLLSLPRDSEVAIPGHGTDKINAAYALGGPKLLVETVEKATGLRMDHYAEIGFGGFAGIVDAIGGVHMCLDKDMNDTETGIQLKAGCQDLTGAQALGFVRMRHSTATPRSDLDRVANQRKFIGALIGQAASPGTLLNPFDFFPLLATAPDALTMDTGDHVHNLLGLALALRGLSSGGVTTTTVPVTSASAENWDKRKSAELFNALRDDTDVPADAVQN